jgi:C4-dicarboxylate transporter, DctM subunit
VILAAGFLVALVLLALGAPLFTAICACVVWCFYAALGEHSLLDALLRIVAKMESLTTKNVFLSLPLFLATGAVMTKGSMAHRLVAVARALTGFLPGGLAIASVLACVIFSSITGSSPVTLTAVGAIMFPALSAVRYPEKPAIGLLTTAGSLGCLVPPSIAMIIYAMSVDGSAQVATRDLFIAGALPATLVTLSLCVYASFIGRHVPREPFSSRLLVSTLRDGFYALLLPLIVLVGIESGLFTPTEAGAVAFVYAAVVTRFVHEERGVLRPALEESAITIGSLLLIVLFAFSLNDVLAEIEAPARLAAWMRTASLSPIGFMIVVNVSLIVVGALMDSISATLIFAPLLAPLATDLYGIDPLHFAVVFVINMEIGYLAPPIATNLFVAAKVFSRPFSFVVRAVLPTLLILMAALAAVIFLPTLSKAFVRARAGLGLYEAFPWDGHRVDPSREHPPTFREMLDRL